MSATGFDPERAKPHDAFLDNVVSKLEELGYEPKRLDVDGDKPDVRITDRDGSRAYIDCKTRTGDLPNYAIKLGALEEYERCSLTERTRTYIVTDDWNVDTVQTLKARIIYGPKRASRNGSNTDFLVFRPGGTPFKDFFPTRP